MHQSLPGYRPTLLRTDFPGLVQRWCARQVAVKIENDRWGLPSFKVVGASWALVRALRDHLPADWAPDAGLPALKGRLTGVSLLAASEGNHGEALAYLARLLELDCRVFVSNEVPDHVRSRICAQGAEVIVVPGTYDDAVAASAAAVTEDRVLVSDTSWSGYEDVPQAVAVGYSTILRECSEQLTSTSAPVPDLVVVPLGVGALASAVIDHFARIGSDPVVVGVEPSAAACVMAAISADRIVSLTGPLESRLSGLNCGTTSMVAWPSLRAGLDAVVALDDDEGVAGSVLAEQMKLHVGPCSGAALAAADALLKHPARRAVLGLPEQPSVLILATDGRPAPATDAPTYPQEAQNV
nr:pyridoxal-phosphate dependent enzyme [Phytoactinopolyspora alkaliphila]